MIVDFSAQNNISSDACPVSINLLRQSTEASKARHEIFEITISGADLQS
jgi:hypothetical protein